MKTINKMHGSPYDRGSADAYYQRPMNPHYMTNDYVEVTDLTKEQELEYVMGYQDQVKSGDFKDYGNDDE